VNAPDEYAFCPHCGADLQMQFVPDEDRERLVCRSCGRIYYINPKIVAGTIPVFQEQVWLLRRAIEPRLGYWTFPAGYMEMGETVEQAAVRETREELNLDIRLVRLLSVYSWERVATVHIVYLADALSQPTGGKETLDFRLFPIDEIPWSDLAFHSTGAALHDWVNQMAANSSSLS